MCFSSKVKTPKVSSNIPAPTPVLEESPKGVEFGSDGKDDDTNDDSTKQITKIDLEKGDEDDSSETPSALSKATSTKLKKSAMSGTAVRKSLSKKARGV